jgi:hypothetical protein
MASMANFLGDPRILMIHEGTQRNTKCRELIAFLRASSCGFVDHYFSEFALGKRVTCQAGVLVYNSQESPIC